MTVFALGQSGETKEKKYEDSPHSIWTPGACLARSSGKRGFLFRILSACAAGAGLSLHDGALVGIGPGEEKEREKNGYFPTYSQSCRGPLSQSSGHKEKAFLGLFVHVDVYTSGALESKQ